MVISNSKVMSLNLTNASFPSPFLSDLIGINKHYSCRTVKLNSLAFFNIVIIKAVVGLLSY